jgi:hypothetical protein
MRDSPKDVRYVGLRAAQKLLGCSRATIMRHLRTGRLPSRLVTDRGKRQKRVVRLADLYRLQWSAKLPPAWRLALALESVEAAAAEFLQAVRATGWRPKEPITPAQCAAAILTGGGRLRKAFAEMAGDELRAWGVDDEAVVY